MNTRPRPLSLVSSFAAAALLVAVAAAAVLALSGCTSLLTPLGENSYDCNRKENPASPYCHSFKAVEASTNGAVPDSRFDQLMSISEHDRLTGIAPVAPVKRIEDNGPVTRAAASAPVAVAPSATPAAAPLEGLPVRVGPVVQRVWVKRFVDDNDLLINETVIYKELIGSHWSGFEGAAAGGAATPGARRRDAYPHRPAVLAPAAPAPMTGKAASDNVISRDAPKSSRNGFTQPGARAPDAGGLVPVPTTEAPPSESGTSSMPQ